MKRKIIILMVLTLVALAEVAWLVDPFLVVILSVYSIAASVLIAAIGLIWILVSKAKDQSLRPALILVAGAIALVALTGLTTRANRLVFDHAEKEAKAYPAIIKPLLEDYRVSHEAYPKSLDELPAKQPIPRLLRPDGYQSDGSSYWFYFGKPGGLIDTWDYSSEKGEWHLST